MVCVYAPQPLWLIYGIVEALDWFTAGRLTHEALQLNWTAHFFTKVDAILDDSRARRLLGYRPVYTMDAAYEDMAMIVRSSHPAPSAVPPAT